MPSPVLLLFGALVAYGIYNVFSAYRHNIEQAKRTGLPYYVAPFCPFNRFAMLTRPLWIPLYKLLPKRYWEDVLPVLEQQSWHFQENHKLFAKVGDSFLVVSYGIIVMYTDNAEVIHQVTSKREAFPKPIEEYGLIAMYGENVVSTEGALWRMHRKITSSAFNEKNTALVFNESIVQARGLIAQWLGTAGRGHQTIKTLEQDTMAWALHIIGYVGFGLRLLWPGQTLPAGTDPRLAKYSSLAAAKGHSMSFADALARVLDYIIVLILVPRRLSNLFPFEAIKKAFEAHDNFAQYLQEFLHDKIHDVKTGAREQGMDIMGQLVRTSYGDNTQNGVAQGTATKGSKVLALSDSEIKGNAFIMMLAGHETTANTLHFTLAQLAANPTAQRLVQRDVDAIFGQSDPSTWEYEDNVNPLLASMVGACINETLRLTPPVVAIPKKVSPSQDQFVTRDGEKYLLPANTHIDLTVVGAQRNPRYWPTRPSKITNAPTDIDDYVPERWLSSREDSHDDSDVDGADTEDFGGFTGSDTSAQLYRPVRGSFIPFSDGARSCLGRRIALVELIAALSVIFQKYSVELAVDEWASDAEVARLSRAERAVVYEKAQRKARETIEEATSIITLKLHGRNFIPVRLVPKGEENFVSWLDS